MPPSSGHRRKGKDEQILRKLHLPFRYRGGRKEESHVHVHRSEPLKVEGNTVFTYLDAFCKDEYFAEFWPDYKNLDEVKEHYKRGGLGDVKVKKFLNRVLEEELRPIRERRKRWEQDIPAVYEILKSGSEKAERVAAQTLKEMRAAMKINYFDDAALIAEQSKKYNG